MTTPDASPIRRAAALRLALVVALGLAYSVAPTLAGDAPPAKAKDWEAYLLEKGLPTQERLERLERYDIAVLLEEAGPLKPRAAAALVEMALADPRVSLPSADILGRCGQVHLAVPVLLATLSDDNTPDDVWRQALEMLAEPDGWRFGEGTPLRPPWEVKSQAIVEFVQSYVRQQRSDPKRAMAVLEKLMFELPEGRGRSRLLVSLAAGASPDLRKKALAMLKEEHTSLMDEADIAALVYGSVWEREDTALLATKILSGVTHEPEDGADDWRELKARWRRWWAENGDSFSVMETALGCLADPKTTRSRIDVAWHQVSGALRYMRGERRHAVLERLIALSESSEVRVARMACRVILCFGVDPRKDREYGSRVRDVLVGVARKGRTLVERIEGARMLGCPLWRNSPEAEKTLEGLLANPQENHMLRIVAAHNLGRNRWADEAVVAGVKEAVAVELAKPLEGQSMQLLVLAGQMLESAGLKDLEWYDRAARIVGEKWWEGIPSRVKEREMIE